MQDDRTPPQRKYALTKIAPGDWLLPGNDGKTVYRLATYEDGPSHGIEGMDRDRTFWGVWVWADPTSRGYVDVQDWDRWEMVESWCETRRDAINAALQRSAPLTNTSAQERT